jgi:tRNA(adenine34) deaminase
MPVSDGETPVDRVQHEVAKLEACQGDYSLLHEGAITRRLAWWDAHQQGFHLTGSLPRQAYTLVFLLYMGLRPEEVPVVYEDERRIVWRSANFCPTLEACLRLALDTRVVCREATEQSVEVLIRRLDDRLRFGRNYATGMRPYAPYCEEMIWLAE